MRGLLADAGLSIEDQRPIRRVPPSFLFPTVLTVASRAA
jgi:hypothetical protein